jgi:integrase
MAALASPAFSIADLQAMLASVKPSADAGIAELISDCAMHYRMNDKEPYAQNVEALWRNHLQKFWGSYTASEITTSKQREYQQKRLHEGAANASVNREIAVMSKALRLGYDHEPRKIFAVPRLIFLPENNARKVFVSKEQLTKIREAAATCSWPWFRVILELGFWLGWRRSELISLRAKDIDLEARVIRLDKTKNGDPREVPLTSKLVALLAPAVVGLKPDTRIFPVSKSTVDRVWREVATTAGFPQLHFHDLRRTSARAKRWAGVDTSIIMEMQGWRTEEMFRRYAIVAKDDKLAAMRKMEKAEK